MRQAVAVCVGAAVLAVVSTATLRSAAAAGGAVAKISRWEITAAVPNGSRILARISNSSTPKHSGNGDITSKWSARWRVKVKILGKKVYIIGANAFSVTGAGSGEYRGYYPKSGGATGSYTCPFGPIVAKKVLTKLKASGQGRTDGKVQLNIGVNGEPGVLPPLTCSGDPVEPEVAKTLSAGVLTGIESACFGDLAFAGPRLLTRKTFTIRKKFGWHPPSPSGQSRPCSGFGSPIWSAGLGTLRVTFTPVT